jgi:hypothetical protein
MRDALVDAESISSRLAHLDELLAELDAIRAAGRDAYAAEWRTRLAAEHALQLAIQACIDVGAHLVSELGLKAPADYRGVFESLCPAGLDPVWPSASPPPQACATFSSTAISMSMTTPCGAHSPSSTIYATSPPPHSGWSMPTDPHPSA